ncbi:hypothetical protein LQZ19_19210, partial [Treponema primitia]|uniref:hypothetical protein n=1 Tax=Treponema primitia TaxID=88058 RepID=UPI00397F8D23
PDGSHFGEIRTDFTVRNNRFNVSMNIVDGNGTRHYSITYVTRDVTPISATALVPGNVYTVASPGDTRWTRLGAPNNEAGTTFVAFKAATSVDGTSGTVLGYTAVTGTEKTGAFPGINTAAAEAFYSGTSDFTNIPDSLLEEDTVLKHSRLFILKVYDTTTTGSIAEQLAQAAIFNIDVDNEDQTKPTAVVNPFHWKNKDDNSLYGNSKDNGHIELEADLPSGKFVGSTGVLDGDPKVSGKISIRGSAEDNNILGSLWVYMDGFTFGGVTTQNIYSKDYAPAADYSSGVLTGVDQWDSNGWKLTVETVSHDQAGHKVNWRLDIDTNRITNIAAVDRPFRVLARDFPMPTANTSLEDSTQTIAAAKTPYYRMDVVPYISSITTGVRNQGGLKNNNIRSADGKYSVIQGSNDTFITVAGFNLTPITDGVRILDADTNTAYNPAATILPGTALTFSGASATGFLASNDSLKSGYLAVYSGTAGAPVGTLNNINNNDSAGAYTLTSSTNGLDQENQPNREADRYITKNIRLTDDRYLQFYTVKQTDVKNGYYPVMLMNDDNPVFGYLDLKGGSNGIPQVGPGTNAGTYYPSHAMPQRTEFNLGTGARQYTEYLIKASIWDAMGMARDESGRYIHATTYNRDGGYFELIYDRYAELHGTGAEGWGTGVGYTEYSGNWAQSDYNNAISLESVNFGSLLLDRFQYPKLIARGNSVSSYARYYMSYYDDNTGELIFRNFRIGNSTANVTNVGRLSSIGSDSAGTAYSSPYINITDYNTTGRLVAAAGASNHFDMAVSSTNVVVVAYYDESDGQLKIKYSNGPVDGSSPGTVVTWLNSPVDLPDYVGAYVSMVMDSSDGLHIAAYDAIDSDLKYIYIPSYSGGSYTAVTVDQYGSVGNWTQIKLHPTTGVPYIAYYNATETGGRDTIKLAYAKTAVTSAADGGVDVNGYTTGKWEYMTIPALTPPQGGSTEFQKVNLGFTTANKPVLGYLGTNIEFSYPVGE